jgi:hypothetical protein
MIDKYKTGCRTTQYLTPFVAANNRDRYGEGIGYGIFI